MEELTEAEELDDLHPQGTGARGVTDATRVYFEGLSPKGIVTVHLIEVQRDCETKGIAAVTRQL